MVEDLGLVKDRACYSYQKVVTDSPNLMLSCIQSFCTKIDFTSEKKLRSTVIVYSSISLYIFGFIFMCRFVSSHKQSTGTGGILHIYIAPTESFTNNGHQPTQILR